MEANQLIRHDQTNRKMEQSILSFRTIHPEWMPGYMDDDDPSAYVNRVSDPLRSANAFRMGATNTRRTSHRFGDFASNSPIGPIPGSNDTRPGPEYNKGAPAFENQDRAAPARGTHAGVTGRRTASPDLLTEMEDRLPDHNYESELGDSFMSPSRAVEMDGDDVHKDSEGVLGLLNHLYQETGTGKGIGM
jgi:hypothetical protein